MAYHLLAVLRVYHPPVSVVYHPMVYHLLASVLYHLALSMLYHLTVSVIYLLALSMLYHLAASVVYQQVLAVSMVFQFHCSFLVLMRLQVLVLPVPSLSLFPLVFSASIQRSPSVLALLFWSVMLISVENHIIILIGCELTKSVISSGLEG